MRRMLLALLTGLVLMLTGFALPSKVLAHERRTIAGKYDVEVGWDQEPTLVGQVNAAAIAVYKAGTETPVKGVQKTLRVQIAFGGNAPKEFPLEAVYGKDGYYVAELIPTRPGSYLFTFVGDIEGTSVNEQFESGPGRFEDVAPIDDLQFPPVTAANEVKIARDEAATARTLAVIGIVMGVVGFVTAGGAILLTQRRK